jgi:hypothetical protein
MPRQRWSLVMSQFPGAYSDPYGATMAAPPKTSGMAVTGLILSLLGIIPCCGVVTAPLGALLGIIAIPVIGSNPMRRGKGLAAVAIVLGVMLTVGQVWLLMWGFGIWVKPVMAGPREALTAAFAGDIAGFKGHLHGDAAKASDAEAKAFIDELRNRYGKFDTCRYADTSGQAPRSQPGKSEQEFPYIFEFENKSVTGSAVLVFADDKTGQMVLPPKWREIRVRDPNLGELTYPPSGTGGPSAP